MTPKQLLQRLNLVVIIATVTSLSGGISAAWWSAGLLGLTLTLAFTFISERILRQRLFGKIGKGLIPIDGEPLGEPALYGQDRFFIDIRTEGESDAGHDDRLAALAQAGHPVVRIVMKSIDHIGQEFFRFELATAVAGSLLGINPFNQPDVEDAKIKTRE